jgi:hypothetical protein
MRHGGETLSGCHPDWNVVALLVSINGGNANAPFLFSMNGDGSMRAGDGTTNLGSHVANTWYDVEIDLTQTDAANATASYKVGGVNAGMVTFPLPSSTIQGGVSLQLVCEEGSCWFDNVEVDSCH